MIRLAWKHFTTNAVSLNSIQWKYDKNVCIFNRVNITQTGRLYYSFQSENAKERNIFSVITRHCLWSKITFSCQLLNFLFFWVSARIEVNILFGTTKNKSNWKTHYIFLEFKVYTTCVRDRSSTRKKKEWIYIFDPTTP